MELELNILNQRTLFDNRTRSTVWLMLDSKAVAWAVIEYGAEYGEYICLCDIETRPGYQHKGYAKALMALVSEELNKPLALTGSMTPEGWAALHGKLPILSGYEEPSGPAYRSMTFVEDWDALNAPL